MYLTGEWQDGDEIYLHFPMEVRCMIANAKVREDVGKVAFTRGPICYCMEEIDNGRNLHLLKADMEKIYGTGVVVEAFHEMGHEMRILKVLGRRLTDSTDGEELYREYIPREYDSQEYTSRGYVSAAGAGNGTDTASAEEPVTMTFVPYYAWNNRGEGEMTVWIRA